MIQTNALRSKYAPVETNKYDFVDILSRDSGVTLNLTHVQRFTVRI